MFLWICLKWPETPDDSTPPNDDLRLLALAMLQYSPKVACFRQDSVVVEVAASLSLFGGIRRLCNLIRMTASRLVPSIRLGMAPSATGAWLLAGAPSSSRRRVLRKGTLVRALAVLPFDTLPETLAYRPWLENIGCRYLACLRKLPRQGLQQRSSPALLQALDAAHAQTEETLAWFVPPADFRLSHEPDVHLDRAEAILIAVQPLLQALCGWLQSRQEALHDLVLVLHHEKGRHACPPTLLPLRFSAATWRSEDFCLLLKERLQHCVLRRPAIRLELIADTPHPRTPANDTLFPDPSRHAQEERRLLDLLTARLGAESIRRPCPGPYHLPEHANTWTSDLIGSHSRTVPASVGSCNRPFWLLDPPWPLPIRQERPVYQGRPLRMVQGPERIETGWWNPDGHQRRDYFVAEDPEGARYWVYRERETGDGWFLHGLFA